MKNNCATRIERNRSREKREEGRYKGREGKRKEEREEVEKNEELHLRPGFETLCVVKLCFSS